MRAVPCGRVSCLLPVQGATTCTFVRTAKSGTRRGLHGLPGYRARSSPPLAASTFERLEADFRSTWHEDLLSPELRNAEGGQHTTAPCPNVHNDHLDDLGLEIGATYRQPPKIWQGEVVAHLLSGFFDEAYLSTVPTHTLNWVIKVTVFIAGEGGLFCFDEYRPECEEQIAAVRCESPKFSTC